MEEFTEYNRICSDLVQDLEMYKELTAKETAEKEDRKRKCKLAAQIPGAEVLDEHLKAHRAGQSKRNRYHISYMYMSQQQAGVAKTNLPHQGSMPGQVAGGTNPRPPQQGSAFFVHAYQYTIDCIPMG